jgi:hypothetical protein
MVGKLEVVTASSTALMLGEPVIGTLHVRGDVLRIVAGSFSQA